MLGGISIDAIISRMALAFIPLALGIIVHEVAHGVVAGWRGDRTAYDAGRITLNPLPHVDPMGLFAFVLTSLSGLFVFGWAKPVPVDYRNLKNPHRDMMLIAAAGPLSNIALAIGFGLLLQLLYTFFPGAQWYGNPVWSFFNKMLPMGIMVNCSLAILNLLPLPPMDGSKIVAGMLPPALVVPYLELERYGFMVLMILLVSGILGKILTPLLLGLANIVLTLVGFG